MLSPLVFKFKGFVSERYIVMSVRINEAGWKNPCLVSEMATLVHIEIVFS